MKVGERKEFEDEHGGLGRAFFVEADNTIAFGLCVVSAPLHPSPLPVTNIHRTHRALTSVPCTDTN